MLNKAVQLTGVNIVKIFNAVRDLRETRTKYIKKMMMRNDGDIFQILDDFRCRTRFFSSFLIYELVNGKSCIKHIRCQKTANVIVKELLKSKSVCYTGNYG
jgi:hypothetical protein